MTPPIGIDAMIRPSVVPIVTVAKKVVAAKPAPRQNEPDLPLFEFSYRIESNIDALAAIEDQWQRLAQTAIEPNSFYEPWFLLPALRQLAQGEPVEVLLIEAPKRVYPDGPKVLCGLFPIVRRRTFYGLPARSWELWRHVHCFLGTPLIRHDCAREVLDYFFEIAAREIPGASVVHLPMIAGDGPLHRLLVDSNHDARRAVFTKDLETRALFESATDAESFLKAKLSRSKRQGVQRIERRLAEQGSLTTRWFAEGDETQAWAEDFLRLEASGWKGTNGSALNANVEQAAFFREMLTGGVQGNRVLIGRLDFNDQPIAMLVNLLARDGGFSFKIAHDEAFAAHSPGLLMELALIRELHDRNILWMDSCATAEHSLINPLWPSRAVRQSLVISTGSRRSELAIALMPLIRWLKNSVFRRHPAKNPSARASATEN